MSSEEDDSVAPLTNDMQSVLQKIMLAKEENPSKFPSYWEMDDEDVALATEEQIANDPVQRILWAAENNKADVVKELLDQSPDLVSATDSDGYTPLHRASYNNHTEIVKILLKRGASINARTHDGWQPLHSACKWNSVDVASLLLQQSVNINSQTNGGHTPLHLTVSERDCRETLELLLMNRYIDTSIRNKVGGTAYDLCIRNTEYGYLFDISAPEINLLDPV